MDWNSVPTSEPDVIFPVGAVIEDFKGRYKVLEFRKQDKVHKYKCEVLSQKIPVPPRLKPFLDDKIQWLIVLPQNLSHITRIS